MASFSWHSRHHLQYLIVPIIVTSSFSGAKHPDPVEPIDGHWAEWTRWTDCSATCGGGGVRVRARMCQPASAYGQQICTRPGQVSTSMQECALTGGNGKESVTPLGCWDLWRSGGKPMSNQDPESCVAYCNSSGYQYGGFSQATPVNQQGPKGFCFCTHDYTKTDPSNRCNSNCVDSVTGVVRYGYLCGSSLDNTANVRASVYAYRNRENGTLGYWTRWSRCDCTTGTHYRNRTCHVNPSNVQNCGGELSEFEDCAVVTEVGRWTEWTRWGLCSLTCGGGGLRTRSKTCQAGCGHEIRQACPLAGQTETEEQQCGLAPCLQQDDRKQAFATPVSPLGCFNIGNYSNRIPTADLHNHPSYCLHLCRQQDPQHQFGYVALTMSTVETGFCYCLADSNYSAEGPRPLSECDITCGGLSQLYPGYMCGSMNSLVGSVYTVRGNISTVGQWTAWSPCSCPTGQVRRRYCELDWQALTYCPLSDNDEPSTEVRDCEPEPCVVCPELNAPENGEIGGDLVNGFTAVKRFKCNEDFELIGSSTVQCTAQGVWEPRIPTCRLTSSGEMKWELYFTAPAGALIVIFFIALLGRKFRASRSNKQTQKLLSDHKKANYGTDDDISMSYPPAENPPLHSARAV